MSRRRPRRWRRWLGGAVLVLLALLILATGGGVLFLRSSLPDYNGIATIRGLTAEVTVIRDANAVPHIFAGDRNDAYRALGYVHAQDRFFQMELMRRVGAGRLSEALGEPTLRFDRLMRALDFYRLAEEAVARMSPPARAATEAYAEGVNAWLASDPRLPPEFLILRITPEPWRPADSVVWGRLMAFQLSGNFSDEVLRARMATQLSVEQIADLWAQDPPRSAATMTDLAALYEAQPLSDLAYLLREIQAPASASNEWVVTGEQSETGMPLLANDPHLRFEAPGLWYLARLVTPEGEVIGATVPGVPFTVVGHNGRIAWGFTTTHADTQDLFLERIDPEDDRRYLTARGSQRFAAREEPIFVRGRDRPELFIARNTAHGPVMTDVSRSAAAATPDGHVLALAFPALRADDGTAEGLYRLNQARDWADFTDAMSLFHAPMQNIVYADTDGAIGFYAPARVPIRRSGDGWQPVPGWTGAHDWVGFVPFDALPNAFNPPAGRIVNANNRLVDGDYPHLLTADWQESYRADRITGLLAARPRHTLDSFAAIQTDVITPLNGSLRETLLGGLPTSGDTRRAEIIARLIAWDGTMDRTRPEPLIYMSWLDALGRRIYADELGDLAGDYHGLRPRVLEHLLTERPAWCDDIATKALENCANQIDTSLDDALAWLDDRLGGDWQDWQWGELHRASFGHQMFGRVPLLRRFSDIVLPSDGGSFTINRGFGLPGLGDDAFRHIVGPGYRAVYDLADLSRSRMMAATGQSGHFLSRHYADLTPRWRDGEYLTLTGDRETLAADAIGTLILRPAP